MLFQQHYGYIADVFKRWDLNEPYCWRVGSKNITFVYQGRGHFVDILRLTPWKVMESFGMFFNPG